MSRRLLKTLIAFVCLVLFATAVIGETPVERAERVFLAARKALQADTNNVDAAVAFVRAAFDWAEYSITQRQRAEIAEEAIPICRALVEHVPSLAAGHYYLGMNLGQLARTKSIGALRIVDEMEPEFKKARELDEDFDNAGPDRNLGLLYLEAPIFSVGDKTKARRHLERALELAPQFPDNQLNFIEALLRWNEKKLAEERLSVLEKMWPSARQVFTGDEWNQSWIDWEARLMRIKAKLGKRK